MVWCCMVGITVDLSDEENEIVELHNVVKKFKDKRLALKDIIKQYKRGLKK